MKKGVTLNVPSSTDRLTRRPRPLICLVFVLIVIFVAGSHTFAADRLIFAMDDPIGDDHGAGSIVYPLDAAFYPHRELLDLRRYEVWEAGDQLRFEFLLGRITNPFHSPEGFYHPRIDVYLSLGGANGKTETLEEGPGVRFSPRWPWHVWLRVAPFGESALVTWNENDPTPTRHPVFVEAVPDEGRIRVDVSAALLPRPQRSWRHYVLIGSFDGFGADGYRRGESEPSRWLLGGVQQGDALVVDLLAPRLGPHSQRAQLSRRDGPPVIQPVGGGSAAGAATGRAWAVGAALIIALWASLHFHRRRASGSGAGSSRRR